MWKAKKQGKRGSEEEESVIDLEERGRPRKKDTQVDLEQTTSPLPSDWIQEAIPSTSQCIHEATPSPRSKLWDEDLSPSSQRMEQSHQTTSEVSNMSDAVDSLSLLSHYYIDKDVQTHSFPCGISETTPSPCSMSETAV
ncbi:uncharacterized protein [Dysidea avara]|uniref:uncharacterized protein n=1 Tax=Dysidea avara TaxID=196820 RepID=UPI003325F75D